MAKPKRFPELTKINGQWFRLTVFKIHTKDEHERPEDCTMIPNERGVEIVGGEEFMTAYVPQVMFPKGK